MYETMTEESKRKIECPERRIVKEGREYETEVKFGNAAGYNYKRR